MADAGEKKGYVRLNHFHGLRLESEDFQVGERYHVEKKKLHNRVFHGFGVVQGWTPQGPGKGLTVIGRKRGDMSIEVTPGYAIDGEGNDVFLHETVVQTIDPGKYKLPTTVYVVIKYVDEPTDFVVNAANPKYKGHRRVVETSKVEVVANPPDPTEAIELARIKLTGSVSEIKDAFDPSNPGDGEIDLRFVPRAGVCGSTLDPELLEKFRTQLGHMRKEFTELGLRLKLHTARDIRDCCVSAQFLAHTNLVATQKDATTIFQLIVSMEDELLEEFQTTYPQLADTREYLNFKENVHGIMHLLKQPKYTSDEFQSILGYQHKACDNVAELATMKPPEPEPPPPPPPAPVAAPVVAAAAAPAPVEAAPPPPPPPPEPEKPKVETPKAGAKSLTWEELQKLSGELPDTIFMDGKNYKMADNIKLVDKASEAEHQFKMDGYKDKWSTNQEYMYPDGTKMQSKGQAHVGGYSQWIFKNLEPGKDLIIAKRIDYAYSGLVTAIYVDGQKVGEWKIEGQDRKFRWRNWLFKIPGSFVKSNQVLIKQESVDAEREVNMFKLWCYQAME